MCHSIVSTEISLLCNVSLYSGSAFLYVIHGASLQWMLVSLWYAMCRFTMAVGFSLVCNVSLYSGKGFPSGMQCVSLQWMSFSLVCNVSL